MYFHQLYRLYPPTIKIFKGKSSVIRMPKLSEHSERITYIIVFQVIPSTKC